MARLTRDYIKEIVDGWSQFECHKVDFTDSGVNIRLENGNKAIDLETPYEIGEFHLNFQSGSEYIFFDWFEIMDDDPTTFMWYVGEVAKNYLENNVKVVKRGIWPFRYSQLQYFNGSKWSNVMSSST